jgi:hypothetical protein
MTCRSKIHRLLSAGLKVRMNVDGSGSVRIAFFEGGCTMSWPLLSIRGATKLDLGYLIGECQAETAAVLFLSLSYR